jgi:peptidyl-prolyl cis-trans isomerase B (cyclophilin B)
MKPFLSTLPFFMIITCLGGCSKSKSGKDTPKADVAVPIRTTSFAQNSGTHKGASPANRFQQPFLEATLEDPPPPGELLPPETTIAGKSVGKMFEAIKGHNGIGGLWERITLTTADGKPKQITAKVITDLGTITIELWPEVAPNHVRNFIALATVGYYNGLGFDQAVHQKVEGSGNVFLDYLEAGCPLGTGEPGYGNIGYWLKPEFSDRIHEAGTIGASHGESLESAAAKFYITLGPAPWLDGNWTVFGKVIRGLDVARTIFQRPVEADFSLKDRVLIREVTIQSQ